MRIKSNFLLPSYLLFTGCSYASQASVNIRNESGGDITNVSVILAGKAVEGGIIFARETRTISGTPPRDGAMRLTYTQGGKLHEVDLTYVAPGLNISCDVEISNDGASKACKAR